MMTNAVSYLLIAFSWSTSNIGDIAITPGLLNLLRETRPGMRAIVITSQARVRSRLPHLRQLGMQVVTEIETGWRP